MRRREFITLVGGAVAWPLAARNQRLIPKIGILNGGSEDVYAERVLVFRNALQEYGYVDGQHVAIEFASANGEDTSRCWPRL